MINVADIEYHGKPGIVIEDPGTLYTDRTGLDTCTAVYLIAVKKWAELPSIGAPHPIFTYLQMEKRELKLQGPFAVAKCSYAGISGDADSSFDERTAIYELSMGVSESPIQTHPKFQTDIAGTPTSPINGAVFRNIETGVKVYDGSAATAASNDGYVFDSFLVMDGDELSDFAGMESYLDACEITWRKTVNLKTVPVLDKIGAIDPTPPGPVPDIGSRTWLNMGVSVTKRGSAYQSVQEWRSSGRRGWNETVYATID